MITAQDIAQAEQAATAAECLAAEAQADEKVNDQAAGAYVVRAARARAKVDQLRRDQKAEKAALKERDSAEAEAAELAKELDRGIQAARTAVTEAVAAAETALTHLVDVVGEYDAAIAGASGDLLARGLAAEVAETVRPLGGTERGRAVRIGDAWWTATDPDVMVAWLVHRWATRLFGRKNRLASTTEHYPHRYQVDRSRLVAGLDVMAGS